MGDLPTIGDMIAKHNELKAYVEAEDKVYDERMKPFKDAMRTLVNTCGALLQEQNAQNFKSDDGTAYLQHGLSVKVDNRADFLKFVVDQNEWRFLDAGVLKDPVREYLDKNSADPPGIKTEAFIKCIIRR